VNGLFNRPIIYLLTLIPSFLFAADNTNDNELNDLLQGFDSTPTEIDKDNIDDVLQGFDDQPANKKDNIDQLFSGFEEEQSIVKDVPKVSDKKWDITTLLSFSSSYNYQRRKPATGETDYRGLSRLKFKLQPEFRYKINTKWDTLISGNAFYDAIYRTNGRSNYTKATLDSNESELEFREVYIRGTLNNDFDVKFGRQIVVWGKSDSIRVVDVLNPLDFREPGMVDIEDLRLPVTMLKADYYFSDWNISAIVIPEIRFNKMPAYGSDFDLSNSTPPHEEIPDNLINPEFALALNGVFSGWDLSFHLARYYDDQAHLVSPPDPQKPSLKHSQLNMIGAAGNLALGNWLLKMESAFIDGLEFNQSQQTFSRLDIMFGADYSGFTDTTLSVEIANRHLNDYSNLLSLSPDSTEENEGQIAFRYTGTFMREKLQLVALASILGTNSDSGAFYRASMEYEIMDAFSVMLGGIVYQSGDSFLINQIADNDRVFFDIRYSF